MKTIDEFLSELRSKDVKLWTQGDSLRYKAPPETITPSLLQELKERKAEILAFLNQASTSVNSNLPSILPAPQDGNLPLSFAQTRLWFLNQLEPDSTTYNMPSAYRLSGVINVTALEQSLNEIWQRHSILRSVFPSVDGQPSQAILKDVNFKLSLIDLEKIPETERVAKAQYLANQEAQEPFDLAHGPLFRAKLLRLKTTEHLLLLTIHHIVYDGWSEGIFLREMAALYSAFCADQPSPLPKLAIQYTDFAVWQRQWLQGEVLESQLSYWKQQLGGSLPILQLPTDYSRPPVQTYQGAYQALELPKNLVLALKSLSQQSGVTLFMTLLAAFKTLLYRYSGQEDIIVGTAIADRKRVETEGLIGFFVNTLPIKTNLGSNPSFAQLLTQVREATLGAYSHQDLPLEKLIAEIQPERDLSRSPLFQVMFGFQNTPSQPWELPGLTITPLEVHNGTAKFDLTLDLKETSQGIKGGIEYNTDLFDSVTIMRMIGHFQTLLEGIVTNPQQHISDLPLLTAIERHQLLVAWNETQTDYPNNICIHQLFALQVEKTPDAVAVIFENQQLTYQELNQRANQLAHYLISLGVKPETPVGICVERSLDLIVALLGILKAGGAYVSLDPEYPQDRLAYMLCDAQISLLLTQKKLLNRLPNYQAQVVCLDIDWEVISKECQHNPLSGVKPDNLAYVIYTSGSTGKPKGVMLVHQGLCNLAADQIKTFDVQPCSKILQFASLNFDASIWEIVLALGAGATLYLGTSDSLLPGSNLITLLRNQSITHLILPPSALSVLPTEELPALQTIVVGGEACSADLVVKWSPGRRFFNAYGPTESTVCATVAEFTDQSQKPVIGRPIANTQIYILDTHLQPVPIGVPGELYIGGAGLARGYLHRPELTSEKFIPHPFSHEGDTRLYKTGDLARYLRDGNIEFLGRIDHQVKIRGFRIELGEIEGAIAQHPSVQQILVTAMAEATDKRLVAYIVSHREHKPTTEELRHFLQQKLPEYMVPSIFVFLDTLPLSPNGKIDRRALPIPGRRPQSEATFVAPRDQLELQLTTIWENVLGIKPISIKDNFFALGGHSLLAVRLFAEIEKTFGKNLPLATLFQAPTVEQIVKLLRPQESSATFSSLVAIQPQGSKPPLFCIHEGNGHVLFYRRLASYLGSDQPFYGLQPKRLDGKYPLHVHTEIEEMATHYIKEIRLIQPHGPYLLGGFCVGGVIAYEMAQQLVSEGEEVAVLAQFDSLIKGEYTLDTKNINRHLNKISQLNLPQKLLYILQKVQSIIKIIIYRISHKLKLFSYKLYNKTGWAWLPVTLKITFQDTLNTGNYLPKKYSGRISLFRASEGLINRSFDSQLGWGEMADGRLDIYDIPSNHAGIFQEPHVQVLAEKLQAALDKAQATQGS